MTIEKKSLIGSLKTTKKADVTASAPATKELVSTRKQVARMAKAFKKSRVV